MIGGVTKVYFMSINDLQGIWFIEDKDLPNYLAKRTVRAALMEIAQDIDFEEVAETCSGHECFYKRTGCRCITCNNQNTENEKSSGGGQPI
jgi:hypothetical protein